MGIIDNLPWYPDKLGFPNAQMRKAATVVWYFAFFGYVCVFVVLTIILIGNVQIEYRRTDSMGMNEGGLPLPYLDVCEDRVNGGASNPGKPSLLDYVDAHLWAYINQADNFTSCVGKGREEFYGVEPEKFERQMRSNKTRGGPFTEKEDQQLEANRKTWGYYHSFGEDNDCYTKRYTFGTHMSPDRRKYSARVLREADKGSADELDRFHCKRFGMKNVTIPIGSSFDFVIAVSVALKGDNLTEEAKLPEGSKDTPRVKGDHIRGFLFRWSTRDIDRMNMTFDPEPVKGIYIPTMDSGQFRESRARGYHQQIVWKNALWQLSASDKDYHLFRPTQFVSFDSKDGRDPVGKAVFKLQIMDPNMHISTYENPTLEYLWAYGVTTILMSGVFGWLMDGIFMPEKTVERTYRFGFVRTAVKASAASSVCNFLGSLCSVCCQDESDGEEGDAAETTPLRPDGSR